MSSNGECTLEIDGVLCGKDEGNLVHKGAYGGLYFAVGRHPWTPCTDPNCPCEPVTSHDGGA